MSRPVTIHSDGTGRGTVILDEDGKEITDIASLSLSVEARGMVEVTFDVIKARLNTQGTVTAVNFVCPLCNDLYEHTCDPSIGTGMSHPLPPIPQCADMITFRDPWLQHLCIRELGHDKKHFDGERTWG